MKILGRLIGTRRQLSCRQVGEVLQSYLDAELDDATAAKVAAHLEDCRRCGLEADIYESVKASLQRRPDILSGEPVLRLREFGERLARDGPDPDEPPPP